MKDQPGKKILINGAAFDRPEDMPPELRAVYDRAQQLLVDADGDGVPDVFQQRGLRGMFDVGRELWGAARQGKAGSAGARSSAAAPRAPGGPPPGGVPHAAPREG